MVDSIFDFLARTEAEALFMKRTRLESDLSLEDMKEAKRNKRTEKMKIQKSHRELFSTGKHFSTGDQVSTVWSILLDQLDTYPLGSSEKRVMMLIVVYLQYMFCFIARHS